MPQPGQTFFSSPSGFDLKETDIKAVQTPEDRQLLALDDAPRGLEDDVLRPSREKPIDAVPTEAVREELDPEKIHNARSIKARRMDQRRDAEITTDALVWASNPDEYDYPGVDTGPMFKDTFGERDPETLQRRDDSFFDF
jgi:hypothetical protein